MKYICPEYKIEKVDTQDIITTSVKFEAKEDVSKNEVEYKTSLEDILGGLF